MFKVEETPYCVWDIDIDKRNLEFLNSIDYRYFDYLADVHSAKLTSDSKQHSALALRTAYHHGLETLFTLLCSAFQAPLCVYGWALKVQSWQLRKLVKNITAESNIFNKRKLEYVSWESLSELIHRPLNLSSEEKADFVNKFALTWRRLSSDFLRNENIIEYNSIKHGLRVRSGGFAIAAGLEKEPGVPAPPERMQLLGSSEFGSSFFTVAEIKDASEPKPSPNFRGKRFSLNWSAESMAQRLELIAMSINNVVSHLKLINGISPEDAKFLLPEDNAFFEKPWEICTGVISCNMDFHITEKHIRNYSRREIKEILDQQEKNRNDGAAPGDSQVDTE